MLRLRGIIAELGLLLLLVFPLCAQVQVGKDTSLSLTGLAAYGYNGSYSDVSNSSHSMSLSGRGTLSGNYHSANFAQFSVTPFYNQSRANSNSESLSNATGVLANLNLFSAGYFPVSLTMQRTYNSTERYDAPGSANYTTHGNNDSWGISWGVRVPKLPQCTFNYSQGNSESSLYGSSGENQVHYRIFSMNSSYRVAGFDLHGLYSNSTNRQKGSLNSLSENPESESDGHAYGMSLSHRIPLRGTLSASAMRNVNNSGGSSNRYRSTYDTLNGDFTIAPIRNLTVNAALYYTGDLAGTIQQEILNNGGTLNAQDRMKSRGLEFSLYSGYVVEPAHLTVMFSTDQRKQSLAGHNYTSSNYQGSLTYSWYLLGGYFNATSSNFETGTNNNTQSTFGSNDTVTYSRYILGWGTSGSLSYRQNTQSALITETTNGISYTLNLFKKLPHHMHFSSGYSGSKSGLSNDDASQSHANSVYTTLGNRLGSITANYSRSRGFVYSTSNGLVSSPDAGTVVDSSLIHYNGDSWGASVGTGPLPGLIMSLSFSRALSDTATSSAFTNNSNMQVMAYVQYQFRRMYVNGGYTRLYQATTGSNVPPSTSSSFYIGISRWFNFF